MRVPLACVALLLTACPSDGSSKKPPATKPAARAEAKPASDAEPAVKPVVQAGTKPVAKPDDGATATVTEDSKFPLPQMLGKAPAEIQPRLGDPTGKGMTRKSCLRFLPERTWFQCAYSFQRYVDPTSTYDAISVTYEDGLSAGLTFEGVPGEGAFEPKAALAQLGVTLVGEPKLSKPEENVELWSWFNGAARLRVHGRQYRVEISSIEGKWETSKVEFILNDPLTATQKATVRAPAAPPSGG
ncbi:MAG: hypothetical protein KUG77_06600 [Nannocystaceae bacterium]|nr:hypothetical protein [Nannocystaceae bacterium]